MLKLSAIKKVISSNYIIDVDLSAIKDTLQRYEKAYGLNLNPSFQRPLVWSEKQRTSFIEFILKGGKVPPIVFNSPIFGGRSSATTIRDIASDDMVIVDGKQRLNTILDFLDGKLSVFGGYFINDIEGINVVLRTHSIKFNVNNINTNNDLLTWYLEMNEGQVSHTEEELNRVKSMLND